MEVTHLKATYFRAHLSMCILMESLPCVLVSQSHNSALDKEITAVGWAPSRCCGRLSLASPDMMVALVSPGLYTLFQLHVTTPSHNGLCPFVKTPVLMGQGLL